MIRIKPTERKPVTKELRKAVTEPGIINVTPKATVTRRKHETNADRQAAYRARKAMKEITSAALRSTRAW